MTELIFAFAAFPLGAVIFGSLGYRVGRRRRLANIDYRDRWEAAVGLLGEEGRLTDEQMAAISKPEPEPFGPHSLFSSDRRDIEVARARAGQPPEDDLEGMFSGDIRDVLVARADCAYRREIS